MRCSTWCTGPTSGSPAIIREFVPMLVERMARDDLRAKLTG